jgi:hypothetical protein
VTLAGANFTAGAKIHFAGIGITITNVVVVSATEITATIHLSRFVATGTHNVEVETAAGSSNTLSFTVD